MQRFLSQVTGAGLGIRSQRRFPGFETIASASACITLLSIAPYVKHSCDQWSKVIAPGKGFTAGK